MIVALCSCSASTVNRPSLPDQTTDESAQVRAATSRVQASESREDSRRLVDEIDLRVNQIGVEGDDIDDGFDVTARLPFNNPAENSAREQAYEIESEVAALQLESAVLEEQVVLCERSVRADHGQQLEALRTDLLLRLNEITEWTQSLEEAARINELDASETYLEARSLEVNSASQPVGYDVHPSFGLPPLTGGSARPLVSDSNAITALIEDSSPAINERLAASQHYLALAELEEATDTIHLNFLELSYQPFPGNGIDDLSAQISVEIPFPGTREAAAERFQLLSEAERFDALAESEQVLWIAQVALSSINHFNAQSTALTELLAAAASTEETAQRWLNDRRSEPRQLLRAFWRVYTARRSVLAEQHRAGQAACMLLASTGLSTEQWPREP